MSSQYATNLHAQASSCGKVRLCGLVRLMLLLIVLIGSIFPASASDSFTTVGDTIIFRFRTGRRMFYSPYKDNEQSISDAARMIDENREAIRCGRMKVRVEGYCTSYPTISQNMAAAKNRSNQVKSYFITHHGLTESNFITTNRTSSYRGNSDIVAMAYLEQIAVEPTAEPNVSAETAAEPCIPQPADTISHPAEVVREESVHETFDTVKPAESFEKRTNQWFIGTNVAYLAAGVSNLNAEWAFNRHWSVELPLVYSPYTISRTYEMRFLYIQPEARYWLNTPGKGHFFGAHAHAGVFNVAVDRHWRYQSEKGFYGAGLSYGYSLPFARHWLAQFEVGVGYTFTRYCKYYNVPNGMRVEKDVPYNYWGPTRIAVSIVYTFGNRKEVGVK